MSSLPEDVGAGTTSTGQPVAWWSAASPVGGDVVLSGAVLLFVAVAFAFVVYHYFTISRRVGAAAGIGVLPSPSRARQQQQQQRGTSLRGGGADGGRRGGGGVDAAVLRALPVTVYRAKDHRSAGDGEALECAVCLAELVDGEAARFLPRCGHGFHAECVDLWLRGHPTCPLCRVDVDKAAGSPFPALPPPSLALPPAMPAPANYPTNLPTNVLFWGSQDAVATAVGAAGGGGGGGPRYSLGAGAPAAALVIEVRDREMAPRGDGEVKARGLARLSSLGRLWNRGTRHDVGAAAASSSSCRQTSNAAAGGTEQASATALDIWNLT
ncbi:unnamed protein product [Urochloa decumbens]|uniref:RING-type E3 ubiquitin transferase n=1 Tax=Urochloa decumbens TaxID=240449 RepID=A0ABC9CWV8_9POAL